MPQPPSCLMPDATTMLNRLVAANNTPHLQQHLYPLFTKYAGSPKNAFGIVMILLLTLDEYRANTGAPNSVVAALLKLQADAFIDALVPDAQLAEESKRCLREMQLAIE